MEGRPSGPLGIVGILDVCLFRGWWEVTGASDIGVSRVDAEGVVRGPGGTSLGIAGGGRRSCV